MDGGDSFRDVGTGWLGSGEIRKRSGWGFVGRIGRGDQGQTWFLPSIRSCQFRFGEREWTNALQEIAAPPWLSRHRCSPSNPALEREVADLEPVIAFAAVELLFYSRFYLHSASS